MDENETPEGPPRVSGGLVVWIIIGAILSIPIWIWLASFFTDRF